MSVKYWSGQDSMYSFGYDGGLNTPVVGEVLNVDGEEGVEYATIQSWSVDTGSWGANNAAGTMWVYNATSAFIANLADNDVIENSGPTKICDTIGGVSDVDGHWDEAGNWGTGEDPAKPVADDEVIFDGRSSTAVTDGIAVGETGGVSLDLLHIKSTFTGDIGVTGERLHINPDKVIFEGTGTMWLECSASGAGVDSDIDYVLVNAPSGTLHLSSDVNSDAFTAQFTDVYAVQATLLAIEADTNIDVLRVIPKNGRSGAVTVTIGIDCFDDKDGDSPMDIYMTNGTLTTDSEIGLLNLSDGTFTFGTDLAASPETGLDITTMFMYGGTFYWQPDDSGGDAFIGDLWLFGGTLNASGATNNDRAKKLGTASLDIHIFEGATLNIANGMGNIAIVGQLWNLGGTLLTDSYTEIGLTYDSPKT